jgi:protein-S-isoprenylcysteine O-methyltransferase Ste14
MKRAADMSWYSRMDRVCSSAAMVFMFGFMAVAVFTRLQYTTPWFYAGLLIVLIGFSANIAAKIGYANADQGIAITTGIYRYSRNPMYASFSLVMLGTVIASQSVFLFIVWISAAACTHLLIRGEERYCLKTYGCSYKEYMSKTPRYFFFF